jgi:hypothetical protein
MKTRFFSRPLKYGIYVQDEESKQASACDA